MTTGKIKVKCPNSKHLVGGGVDAGQRFIQSTYPFDSKDKGKKPDDGWKATTSGLQTATVEVTAACSPVEAQVLEGDGHPVAVGHQRCRSQVQGRHESGVGRRASVGADRVRQPELDASARR